jgi:hypothetical protein
VAGQARHRDALWCTVMRNRVIRVGMAVSPNEAFSLRKDSEKDLEGAFYDYCKAYRKPERKNGHEIMTLAALKLLPMLNGRGGYYYYDLVSEAVSTGTRTVSLPMLELAIQKIIQIWKRRARELCVRHGNWEDFEQTTSIQSRGFLTAVGTSSPHRTEARSGTGAGAA